MRSPILPVAVVAVGLCLLPAVSAAADDKVPLKEAKATELQGGPSESLALPGRVAIPRRTLDPALERRDKANLAASLAPVTISPSPQTAVLAGVLNQPGVSAGTTSPPDTTGTIGPSHYVEATNNQVAVYSRASLSPVGAVSIDAFTGRAGSCDPQIQWDQPANRYFYTAIDCTNNAANYALLFGWSKTADPTDLSTGWCRFTLNTSATGTNTGLSDYPKLGHNSQWEIIGTNDFNPSFTTARVWMFGRPTNGDASCAIGTIFHTGGSLLNADGSQTFTPVPVNEVDGPSNGWIVAAHFPSGAAPATASKIELFHVSGLKTSPPAFTKDGAVSVPSYGFPVNIPQPGTASLIDASDTRLTQAVGRSESAIATTGLWTQHTVNGPGGLAQVRWYEINPVTKTTRQVGNISIAGLHVFNGAVSPTNSSDESAMIQFNTGSGAEFVKIRARSRTTGDGLGGMAAEIVLGTSSVADTDFTCSPCRWGDYAGASPDMSVPGVVWGSSQLNGPNPPDPQWTTRNFAIMTQRTVVSLSGSQLVVQAPNGVGANIGVTKPTSSTLQVTDSRNGTRAGAGCTAAGSSSVSCPAAGITQLAASAVGGGTPAAVTSPLP